ncbi:hypothetical protein [Nocardia asteroides]|uniref:hypothetical protein n=1 Tax=Nocardia asteroides TaxID=1824 RepID=UPI0033DE96BE
MAREYHWIMTLQWPVPGTGFGIGSADGIWLAGDFTRMQAFRELRKVAARALDAPETAHVVFFAIEREERL